MANLNLHHLRLFRATAREGGGTAIIGAAAHYVENEDAVDDAVDDEEGLARTLRARQERHLVPAAVRRARSSAEGAPHAPHTARPHTLT